MSRSLRFVDLWICVGLFLGSLALRLYFKNAGLFLYDAVRIAQATEASYETGELHGQVNGRPGSVITSLLFYVPYRWWTGQTSAEQSVLLANLVLASLAIALLYPMLRLLFEDRVEAAQDERFTAFAAALLLGVSPILLSITTYGKPHGIELFWTVSTFACLLAFDLRQKHRWLVAGALTMGAALLSREAALLFLPLYALVALRPTLTLQRPFVAIPAERRSLRALLASFLPLALALALAWFAYLGEVVGRSLFEAGPGTVSFQGIWWPALARGASDFAFDLTWVGIPLVLAGVVIGWRRSADKLALVFLLAWSALFFVVANTPAYWTRLLGLVSVPAFAFIGLALGALWRRKRWVAALATVALGGLLFSEIAPVIEFRRERSGQKEFALWLAAQVPRDALVIAMDDAPHLEYYAGLETWSHPVSGEEQEIALWLAETVARARTRPLFATSTGFGYDPGGKVAAALRTRFRIEQRGRIATEDYHHSATRLRHTVKRLFRLIPRPDPPATSDAGPTTRPIRKEIPA